MNLDADSISFAIPAGLIYIMLIVLFGIQIFFIDKIIWCKKDLNLIRTYLGSIWKVGILIFLIGLLVFVYQIIMISVPATKHNHYLPILIFNIGHFMIHTFIGTLGLFIAIATDLITNNYILRNSNNE